MSLRYIHCLQFQHQSFQSGILKFQFSESYELQGHSKNSRLIEWSTPLRNSFWVQTPDAFLYAFKKSNFSSSTRSSRKQDARNVEFKILSDEQISQVLKINFNHLGLNSETVLDEEAISGSIQGHCTWKPHMFIHLYYPATKHVFLFIKSLLNCFKKFT